MAPATQKRAKSATPARPKTPTRKTSAKKTTKTTPKTRNQASLKATPRIIDYDNEHDSDSSLQCPEEIAFRALLEGKDTREKIGRAFGGKLAWCLRGNRLRWKTDYDADGRRKRPPRRHVHGLLWRRLTSLLDRLENMGRPILSLARDSVLKTSNTPVATFSL